MSRLAALLLLPLLAAPAAAQDADAPDMTGAVDVVPLECVIAGEGVACTVETDGPATFCMAVDADGEPLANSTGATDAGEILFQDVDAERIAALRCRPV